MIHKVTPRRPTIIPLLKYMLRNGHGHEHDLNLIDWIGSSTFAQDPIARCKLTGLPLAEQPEGPLNELIDEFEEQSALHKGKAENFYAHYVISQHPEDRQLTKSEWYELITEYLEALGYDNSCKWASVEHRDKDHYHAHISSSVVRDDGSIVDNTDDVHKGFSVLRRFEQKFGLKQLTSPDENWGKHYSKGEIKAAGGNRQEAMSKDWAARIRARFKAIESENGGRLPSTMTNLVLALAKKGVAVKARQNECGEITGLNYKADNGPWISGSKVKASKLTFSRLTNSVSYSPERDNSVLLGNEDLKINAAVQITETQYQRIKILKPRLRVFKRNSKYYASFTFYNSKKEREFAEMLESIMKLIALLLDPMFSVNDDNLFFFVEDQFEYEYAALPHIQYDAADYMVASQKLRTEHSQWIKDYAPKARHLKAAEAELCVN